MISPEEGMAISLGASGSTPRASSSLRLGQAYELPGLLLSRLARARRILGILVASGLLLLPALPALAQRPTATIVGTVKDSSGGAIQRATVTVTDEERGFTRSSTTNAAGFYSLPELDAGRYKLRAFYPRFRTKLLTGIVLNVATMRVVDVVLEPGEIAAEISVEAPAFRVQTVGGDLSGLVTGDQIRELPLNGRNLMQLTLLQPGVIPGDSFNAKDKGLLTSSALAVSGGTTFSNLWTVDGVNNNDVGANESILVFPSIDAIEEFRIQRNSYGAEFGQASGAHINIVTRGGTNTFHGSVFYSGRDDALSATNYFLAKAGQEKEKLSRHDFGWTFAGPIIKDKLHFFALQEWNRERRGDVRMALVPTAAERGGDFSGPGLAGCSGPDPIDPLSGEPFPGNRIPADRLSPAGLLLLQLYPLPNTNPTGGSCANWVASVDTPINWREDSIRLDYAISNTVRLMARYIQDSWVNGAPNLQSRLWGDDAFPIVDSRWSQPGRSFLLQLNHAIGSAGTNALRFSYSGNEIKVTRGGTAPEQNDEINAVVPAVFDNRLKLYGAERAHASLWGSGGYETLMNQAPFYNVQELYVLRDDYTAVFGRHFVKAGVLASWNKKDEDSGGSGHSESPIFLESPAGTGNAMADRLLRDMTFFFFERSAQHRLPQRWRDLEAYLADTWRLSPRVTLDLGVRYSAYSNPYAADDRVMNFQPDRFDPALGADPCNGLMQPPKARWCQGAGFRGGTPGTGRSLYDQEHDLFAPRFGVAWDVFGNGRTALRAGAGLFFDHESLVPSLTLGENPPFTNAAFGLRKLDTAEPCAGCFSTSRGVPLTGRERKAITPNTWQWNATFEQALLPTTTLVLSYVGSKGTHLLRRFDVNQVRQGDRNGNDLPDRLEFARTSLPEVRPYGVFGDTRINFWDHGGSSTYHALETQLRARWGRGSQLQGSYTWSRTITDQTEGLAGLLDVDRPALDRGLARNHRTHVFSSSLVLPLLTLEGSPGIVRHFLGDWAIGALVFAASGSPVTVLTGTVPGLSGGPSGTGTGFNQRPNRVPGQPCRASGGRREQWLNPEAFTLVGFELGTIGDGGRGTCTGPGLFQVDLALYKSIPTGKKVKVQLRFEAFNVFNRTQFSSIDDSMDPTAITLDAPIERATRITSFQLPNSFGQATAARDPRQLQLGIRLSF